MAEEGLFYVVGKRVNLALDVSDCNKIFCATVANIGVNGQGTTRIASNEVGRGSRVMSSHQLTRIRYTCVLLLAPII